MQSKVPVYPYNAKTAQERGELDKWRESFRENCACAGGIDILILENFDGMHLKAGEKDHRAVRQQARGARPCEYGTGAARRWALPSGQPSLGKQSLHSTRRNA